MFAALATVGTWLGSLANQAVSADLLMYAFALLLICVGLVMLRRAYPGLFRGSARAGSSGVFSDDGAAAADNAGGTSSTSALRAVSATGGGYLNWGCAAVAGGFGGYHNRCAYRIFWGWRRLCDSAGTDFSVAFTH